MESIAETHQRKMLWKNEVEIRCSKCKSEDVVIKTNNGYFWVCGCNKCGYKK